MARAHKTKPSATRTQVDLVEDRVVLMSAWAGMYRILRESTLPAGYVGEDVAALVVIGNHVARDHALFAAGKGKPATVSKLARDTKIPRNTVKRKLDKLIAWHVLARERNAYFMAARRAVKVPKALEDEYRRELLKANQGIKRFLTRLDNSAHQRG